MMKPEQTPEPGWPDGETLQKQLYGGLKGRICNSLGAVSNALETMADALKSTLNPAEYEKMQPLLGELDSEFRQIRRLTEYTADAALGTALGQMYTPHLMNLLSTLEAFCRIFNEEAPLAEYPAKVRLQGTPGIVVPTMGDEHLIGALLANLFSNAVGARDDCTITLSCTMSELTCHDDGPGMSADAQALLTQDSWSPELVEGGGIGLLLIRRYALAMGWTISVECPTEGGTTIRFALPPCSVGEGKLRMQSNEGALAQAKRCRALLRRELETLPKPERADPE